jgi:hypothetical protein
MRVPEWRILPSLGTGGVKDPIGDDYADGISGIR